MPSKPSSVHQDDTPGIAESADAAAIAAKLIRSRRTVHDFLPAPPPAEIVQRGIEIARWAPNHRLTEPWRFYLLGPETALAIAERNAQLVAAQRGKEAGQSKLARWREIPGWLAVTCARGDDAEREREDYAACCCAIQNLQLYLWSEGIGMKWTTGQVTRDPQFYDLIWVDPDQEFLVGLMWYGYAAEVPRTQRKPVSHFLVELP